MHLVVHKSCHFILLLSSNNLFYMFYQFLLFKSILLKCVRILIIKYVLSISIQYAREDLSTMVSA